VTKFILRIILKMNFSIIYKFFVILCFLSSSQAIAKYPKISGDIIIDLGIDRLSVKNNNVKKYNSILEFQSDISLDLNRNWSVQTLWQSRKVAKNYYLNRQSYDPIISSNDRQMSIDDESLFIEELKLNFQNEDLVFFAGKYNPHFGNSWNKKRKSSIFTVFFGRDYQLREKIGLGITALFEESELSFYPFFNDNTDLSNSAINRRGRNKRSYQVSGNNGSLSSYVVALSGKNFLYVEDLSYHLAHKKLDVSSENLAEENGYVINFEYLFKIGNNSSIIPFYEFVKTNNMNGTRGQDVNHQIASLNFNYSSWDFAVSYFTKDIKKYNKISDKYLEYSLGYKISDSMGVEVSRINGKENNINHNALYTMFSYIMTF